MNEAWKPKQADRIVRHPRQNEIGPVVVRVTGRHTSNKFLTPPLILIYTFFGLIVTGALLLELPFTHNGGGFTPFMTALFTATSALTVTGLTIEDTANYWTRTGQVAILAMIFIGGLGYMTIATFFLMIFGRRVSLAGRLLLRESLGIDQLGGLLRLTIGISLVTVVIQIIGFGALFIRFQFLYAPAEAVWQAVFHSVSAFNNAGFTVLNEPQGLIRFRSDVAISGIIALLVILGGISYWVMVDVVRHRKFSLLTLNTKLVLILTVILLAAGTVMFVAAEYDNPLTLGPLPISEKLLASFFESVNSRTAGFSTVDLDHATQETDFFTTSLMFIGGATGSVAGGIKLNTFGVLLVSVWAIMRGKTHTSIFGREIPQAQVLRAVAIVTVSAGFVFLAALLLTFSDHEFQFIDLFFESVSAFSTVGLSTGLTPHISALGHLILIAAMLIGRIGPFAIAFAMANRTESESFRYAQEGVVLG